MKKTNLSRSLPSQGAEVKADYIAKGYIKPLPTADELADLGFHIAADEKRRREAERA